ncbi:Threonine aldolase [Clydaea vesicula]|uniref:Threonine aldolase n=1 Tax=Clydaea vesicula TaxID=447962 RepID=A0AAD5TYC1_9FUNG|nr:Threonine aldolase [Clydaea vesicula]
MGSRYGNNGNKIKLKFDFRSDTVTRPTPRMLSAMLEAETGDDVFNEDPTVNKLQGKIALLANKEGSLFCPSATMTNQLAVRTHLTQPPYTVLCDYRCHLVNYEAGAHVTTLQPENGLNYLTAETIKKNLILDDDIHHSPTKLICLENTLNGEILSIEEIKKISELARFHGIKLHLDGARIWNACVATGLSLSDYCQYFDSISVCLSKGLGAPVGSVLIGSAQFLKKAKHFRKMYGGGWRQAGILAAGGLYALEHHLSGLKTDMENAKYVSEKIKSFGFTITKKTETNMVWFEIPKSYNFSVEDLKVQLEKFQCVIFGGKYDYECRLVFHHEITKEGCDLILEGLQNCVKTFATIEKDNLFEENDKKKYLNL